MSPTRATLKKVAQLRTLELLAGSHTGPEDGMCVMEAVAYFAGEPFSDHPACVSPIIGAL